MAQDYFSQEISQPQTQDFFSKEITPSRQPSDATPEMSDAQWGANHPYLRAIQNSAVQGLEAPAIQETNEITPAINGLNKFSYQMKNIPPNQQPQPLPQIPVPNTKIGSPMANASAPYFGDVATGVTQGLAATAIGGGNPIVGYGVLSGLQAKGQGNNLVPAVIGGAMSGLIQGVVGIVGKGVASTIANKIANAGGKITPEIVQWVSKVNPQVAQMIDDFGKNATQGIIKYATKFGQAVGMGGVGATQNAVAGKSPVEGFATGATFGLMPSGQNKPIGVTPEQYQNSILPKAGEETLKAYNPLKNAYDYFSRNGKDIDQAAQTLAEQGIVPNKTGDNERLDNQEGMDKIMGSISPLAQRNQQMLATNKSNQFNLEAIRDQSKQNLLTHPDFKDPQKLAIGNQIIDDKIDAAIKDKRYGNGFSNINGEQLDQLKSGWWTTRYDDNNKFEKPVAGQLGNIAKSAIEKAYPNQPIAENNQQIGKLYDAHDLLDYTHNNIIKGGKLGNMMRGIGGAMIGNAAGKVIPIPGAEPVTTALGAVAGENIGKAFNDPTAKMMDVVRNLRNYTVKTPVITPQVMPRSPKAQPQGVTGVGFQPSIGLPSPRNVSYNPSQHANLTPNGIRMPNTSSGEPIEIPPLKNFISSKGTQDPIYQQGNAIEPGYAKKFGKINK